ncbi:tyrosine-protein phosphatase [Endozoicomonas acroporae]|uniref:tyrosine-protein phosphatase n=1 Tax=Endozoicomonas acroporae TaxID=1701104 RepID=UPI000C7618E9|nr:tyrosine-protein phosphatase [Endozoicomonas acroporae]
MSSNGLGSLTPSQINQINQLASIENSEEYVLVAQSNGKEVKFNSIKPRLNSSEANKEKPVEGSDLAVKTLGLKDRKVSPALAKRLIEAYKKVSPPDVIFVDKNDVHLLMNHVDDSNSTQPPDEDATSSVDSVRNRRSSANTLHSGWGSTTSLDSGYNSVYGSTESLYDDVELPREITTSPLSEKVTELINKENYIGAHIQMRDESLAAIKGKHITNGRWSRFGFSDKTVGNVPLPKKTALTIDGNHIPANNIELTNARYVAIQAPRTKAQMSGGDIWRAALDSGCSVICDLTRDNEKFEVNKGGPIASYYPTGEKLEDDGKVNGKVDGKVDREIVFDNGIKVRYKAKQQEDGYSKIKYAVTDPLTGKTRVIRRYHYTGWPDHGVPNETNGQDSLLRFVEALRTHQVGKDYSGNTMVHCMAGVGRTGTLIVLNEIYRDILSGKYQNKKELDQAVFKTIQQGRKDRGPAFVQSADQIKFIMNTVHTWQDQRDLGENIIPRI